MQQTKSSIVHKCELTTKKGFPIMKWMDVVTLFQDHELYYSNVEKHMGIIYFFQYGIFCSGHNNWLIEAATIGCSSMKLCTMTWI